MKKIIIITVSIYLVLIVAKSFYVAFKDTTEQRSAVSYIVDTTINKDQLVASSVSGKSASGIIDTRTSSSPTAINPIKLSKAEYDKLSPSQKSLWTWIVDFVVGGYFIPVVSRGIPKSFGGNPNDSRGWTIGFTFSKRF